MRIERISPKLGLEKIQGPAQVGWIFFGGLDRLDSHFLGGNYMK